MERKAFVPILIVSHHCRLFQWNISQCLLCICKFLCFQERASTLIKKRAGDSPVPHPKSMWYVIRCVPYALLHQERKSIQYSNRSGKHCLKTRSAPFFTMGPLGAFILPIKTTDMDSFPGTMLSALYIVFYPHSNPM